MDLPPRIVSATNFPLYLVIVKIKLINNLAYMISIYVKYKLHLFHRWRHQYGDMYLSMTQVIQIVNFAQKKLIWEESHGGEKRGDWIVFSSEERRACQRKIKRTHNNMCNHVGLQHIKPSISWTFQLTTLCTYLHVNIPKICPSWLGH